MSKPSGFRSRGHGDDRKIYPVFDPTTNVGKPLRSSQYMDGSRQQLYEQHMDKIDKTERKVQAEGIYCDHDGIIKQKHCGKCLGKESYSKSHELRQYTVNLKYADGSRETVKVEAHSPEESIHLGMLKVSPEHRQQRPTSVTSKNLIGEIVGKLGAWGIGGLKKTIKTYKETRRKSTLQERAKKGDIAAIRELRRLKTEEDIRKGQEEALKEERLV